MWGFKLITRFLTNGTVEITANFNFLIVSDFFVDSGHNILAIIRIRSNDDNYRTYFTQNIFIQGTRVWFEMKT